MSSSVQIDILLTWKSNEQFLLQAEINENMKLVVDTIL